MAAVAFGFKRKRAVRSPRADLPESEGNPHAPSPPEEMPQGSAGEEVVVTRHGRAVARILSLHWRRDVYIFVFPYTMRGSPRCEPISKSTTSCWHEPWRRLAYRPNEPQSKKACGCWFACASRPRRLPNSKDWVGKVI